MDEQKWLVERKQIGVALGLIDVAAIAKYNVAPIALVLAAIEKLQARGNESLADEVTELGRQLLEKTALDQDSFEARVKCLQVAGRLVSAKKVQTSIDGLIEAAVKATLEGG